MLCGRCCVRCSGAFALTECSFRQMGCQRSGNITVICLGKTGCRAATTWAILAAIGLRCSGESPPRTWILLVPEEAAEEVRY